MTDRGLDKVLFERNNQRASIYLKSLRARFLKEDAQKIIYELIQIDSYIGKIDNKLHLIDHQDQNALLNLLYSSNYIDIKSLKERLLNCANSLSSVALDYQLLIQFLTIKVLCLTGDFEDANMLLDKINIAKYLDNGSKLAFKSGNRMLADCFFCKAKILFKFNNLNEIQSINQYLSKSMELLDVLLKNEYTRLTKRKLPISPAYQQLQQKLVYSIQYKTWVLFKSYKFFNFTQIDWLKELSFLIVKIESILKDLSHFDTDNHLFKEPLTKILTFMKIYEKFAFDYTIIGNNESQTSIAALEIKKLLVSCLKFSNLHFGNDEYQSMVLNNKLQSTFKLFDEPVSMVSFEIFITLMINHGIDSFHFLTEVLYRACPTFTNNHWMWYHFAVCLFECKLEDLSVRVLRKCLSVKEDFYPALIFMVYIQINYANQLNEALELLEKFKNLPSFKTLSKRKQVRIYMAHGVCLTNLSLNNSSFIDKKRQLNSAIKQLTISYNMDKNDCFVNFHLAYVHAVVGNINEAYSFSRNAAKTMQNDIRALLLFALCKTSYKKYDEASNLLKDACEYYPDDILPHLILYKIEISCSEYRVSLKTIQTMLDNVQIARKINNLKHVDHIVNDSAKSEENLSSNTRTKTIPTISTAVDGLSVDASFIESVDLLHFTSNFNNKLRVLDDRYNIAKLLTVVSQIYIDAKYLDEAQSYVNELKDITGRLNVDYLLLMAQIEALKHPSNLNMAIVYLETALTIDSSNMHCYELLIEFNLKDKKLISAERLSRRMVQMDASSYISWAMLGKVLAAQGIHDEAFNCLNRSITIGRNRPVVSFSLIPNYLGYESIIN